MALVVGRQKDGHCRPPNILHKNNFAFLNFDEKCWKNVCDEWIGKSGRGIEFLFSCRAFCQLRPLRWQSPRFVNWNLLAHQSRPTNSRVQLQLFARFLTVQVHETSGAKKPHNHQNKICFVQATTYFTCLQHLMNTQIPKSIQLTD